MGWGPPVKARSGQAAAYQGDHRRSLPALYLPGVPPSFEAGPSPPGHCSMVWGSEWYGGLSLGGEKINVRHHQGVGAQRRPETTPQGIPASPSDLHLGRSPDTPSLSPIHFNSRKVGTSYPFSSKSGERESSFLGPVRACSALQTTSLRPMSVSRGSKPCRKEDREDQAGEGVLHLALLGPAPLPPWNREG